MDTNRAKVLFITDSFYTDWFSNSALFGARPGYRKSLSNTFDARCNPYLCRPLLKQPEKRKEQVPPNSLERARDFRACVCHLHCGSGWNLTKSILDPSSICCRIGSINCYEKIGDGPMIRFHNVTLVYPYVQRTIFEDLSFEVPEGEFVLVMGDTGAGKSTLLKLMNGLVPHHTGGIFPARLLLMAKTPRCTSHVISSISSQSSVRIPLWVL